MTTTQTPRRFRLVTNSARTIASVQDTGRVEFGVRNLSTVVVPATDYAAARAACERLEAEWMAEKVNGPKAGTRAAELEAIRQARKAAKRAA